MQHPLADVVFCLHFLLVSLLTRQVLSAEYDYTVEVPAGKLNCFFQTVEDDRHKSMEIDFQVIDGGDLDLNFYLSDPTGTIIGQDVRKMDATHKVDVSKAKGDYQLCFDNTFSYQAAKLVFFEILLMDDNGFTDDQFGGAASGPESDFLKKVDEMSESYHGSKDSLANLKSNLNKAEHTQAFLRAYESRDRAIMEANYERVNFWSMVNAGIMLSLGILQVYMIRSLFEENSKLGKVLRH